MSFRQGDFPVLSRALECLVLFIAAAPAVGAEDLTYELRQGSLLRDDCLNCDRPVFDVPITGSFVLTPVPSVGLVGSVFEVSKLELQSEDGRYSALGVGVYSTSGVAPDAQEMSLTLDLGGAPGIQLESGVVKVAEPFPLLDVTVTEDGARDPFHVFTIRIVAAPAATATLYSLGEGSTISDNCCEEPIIRPITGTFLLGQIEGDPNPNHTYRIDSLDFRTSQEAPVYVVRGLGVYREGGEVALTNEMDLEVQINDERGVILGSARVVPGVPFPEIDIEIIEIESPDPLHEYSLRIVAAPVKLGDREFRRGDSNGDGGVNIADAVHILLWRFGGGEAPGCLDAADVNDDDLHDLSDAIFELNYLFLSGPAPPAPGAADCGPAGKVSLGCEQYPVCG